MPKRSSKPRTSRDDDVNTTAFRIVREATADPDDSSPSDKNPAAVALGRLGGLKGGKARAEKLSAKRRSAIAKKAAKARWEKGDK
jgi:hypothetical protein